MEEAISLISIAVVRNHYSMYSTCKNVRPSSRKRRNGGSVYELLWRSTQPARVRNWAPDTAHIGVTSPEIITNRPEALPWALKNSVFIHISLILMSIWLSLPWRAFFYKR
jgi:3-methyladenine DNA glycosylase Tag